MSDKRYPTRMHEVLGVEPFEKFQVVGGYEGRNYSLDKDGWMRWGESNWESDVEDVYNAINHGIARRPRLTEEQVRVLKALYEVFDFKWLAKQKDGRVMTYANKPNKSEDWYGFWFHGEGDNEEDYGWMVKSSSPVCSLVSWSDPAPLDIVQVLRQNGVEVEG